MKRLIVVVALLAIMLVMRELRVGPHASRDLLTLAAIGFVVLTAFVAAEMGTRLSLPRVTGYIIAGLVLGPSIANILSADVVTEMRMFNTLALGLIATSAGLELDVKSLLPLLKTLGATTAIKVVLGVPLVGAALFGMAYLVDLGVPSPQGKLALALIIGVLSIGTSPSIALAILAETKAKGRLTDLVLGAAVFKDLVVVVSLAVGLAIVSTLLSPDSSFDASVIVHVSKELIGSIVAGAALGGILIAYIRFIRAEMLLFVAAMILVVAELCRALHLELLLVFIAAGFVVRNFSKHEHDLAGPLELVALPVFVVFFTIAGASIQLAATWAILPAALAACVVRAGVYWVAARVGSSIGRESQAVRANAWSAYLPQAGVTLGLVGLAAEKVPLLSAQITGIGLAVVAINLLIGPIALRLALLRAGEVPGALIVSPTATQPAIADVALSSGSSPQPRELGRTVSNEASRLVAELEVRSVSHLTELIRSDTAAEARLEMLDEPPLEQRLHIVRTYREAARAWYDQWVTWLALLPSHATWPVGIEAFASRKGDPWYKQFYLFTKRAWWRLSSKARVRKVPVRLCARLTVERTIAQLASRYFEASLDVHFSGAPAPSPSIPEGWNAMLEQAFHDFAQLLDVAGGPRRPTRTLRFSDVELAIRADLYTLEEGRDELYAARASAIWGSEVAKRRLTTLQEKLQLALTEHSEDPATRFLRRAEHAFDELSEQLSSWVNPKDDSPVSANQQLSSFAEVRQQSFDDLSRAFRASAVMRELGAAFRAEIETLPRDLRCYYAPLNNEQRLGTIRRLDLAEVAEKHLVKRLLPALDQSVRGLSLTFAQIPRRMRDIVNPMLQHMNATTDHAEPITLPARDRVQTTLSRIEGLKQQLSNNVAMELENQRAAFASTIAALEREIVTAQPLAETTTHLLRVWLGRLGRLGRGVKPWDTSGSVEDLEKTDGRDARAIRESLVDWLHPALPDLARLWFSQRPVRDERIYSVPQSAIDHLLEEEARWRDGHRTAVLVRGPLGCGHTSLLNMCELEFRTPRVVRLDAEGPEQARTLMDALASAFGTGVEESDIADGLSVNRPIVLVDNLTTWLLRSKTPLEELGRLLTLISRTPESLWIVAADLALLDRLSPFTQLQVGFTSVLDIPPVNRKQLSHIVRSRAARANLQIEFRSTLLGSILRRLGLPGDELLYFASLARTSIGNPGRALAQCQRSAVAKETSLLLDVETLRAARPTLTSRLSAVQLSILITLLRNGSSDTKAITSETGLSPNELELELAFLTASELVAGSNRGYAVSDGARWLLTDELEKLGALYAATGRHRSRYRQLLPPVVGVGLLVAAFYLVQHLVANPRGLSWVLGLGGVGLLLLPRWGRDLRATLVRILTGIGPGDNVHLGRLQGTFVGIGLLHLLLRDSSGATIRIPFWSFLATRYTVEPGSGGVLLSTRLVGRTSATEAKRAAQLCPYRCPASEISIKTRGESTVVKMRVWHGNCSREVAAFFASKLGLSSDTVESTS